MTTHEPPRGAAGQTPSSVLSISQITQAIKNRLESTFSNLIIQGEITNFKQQASGHLYFTLKDENAQISAVCFRGNAQNLPRMPKSGDKVMVKGDITVYPPRGNYQILIKALKFAGTGDLLLQLHERKRKLAEMGWFDNARKKPLPPFPKRIGVITSPTGAVIQDILNVLKRRFSGFHLILNPVRVQGDEAAGEIARAINQMNKHQMVDLLIVGRGGGSLEDLWAFNELEVAEAVYNSHIPIISAVGHETDYSICDFVADRRAPTPSAAAEIAVSEKSAVKQFLDDAKKRLVAMLRLQLENGRSRLSRIEMHPLIVSKDHFLGRFYQKIDPIPERLAALMLQTINSRKVALMEKQSQLAKLNPQAQLKSNREKLTQTSRAIEMCFIHQTKHSREKLLQTASHLRSIDPKNLLKKGYGILFREKDQSAILSASDVCVGDPLRVMMGDGQIETKVTKVTKK